MSPSVSARRRLQWALTAPAVLAVGGLVALLSWAVDNTTYDTWGGTVVGVVLLLVNLPIVIHLARKETDGRVARLLPWALVLKLAASAARLAVVFGVYDGAADASVYHDAGQRLAESYRHFDFGGDVGVFLGTGFVKALTGGVYALIGVTKVGGFVTFSLFGFWGLYFFYRAFCVACPEGDRWRYACLVFLLPSMLFWPSSVGKEAWITLTLGLGAYGGARILTRKRGGFVVLALGLAGTMAVRPHVSVILMVSLLAAYFLRRPPAGGSLLGPVGKLVGVVFLGLALAVVIGQTKELFGVRDRFNAEAVQQILDKAQSQTSGGGSVFDANQNTNLRPSRFPSALVSVLFRPFPWEAGNPFALIASLEGTLLLALFVVSWRRVAGSVRSVLRTPYVVLCLCYSVLFVYGFSSFANFGILTRQRVQVLPFVLVLLALPPFRRTEEGWRGLLVANPVSPEPEPEPEPALAGGRQAW